MKKYLLALCVPAVFAAASAFAQGAAPASASAAGAASASAAGDCNSVGQKMAVKQHGKLVSASPSKGKNGKPNCVVIVSVPSSQGEKPRRVELSVPLTN